MALGRDLPSQQSLLSSLAAGVTARRYGCLSDAPNGDSLNRFAQLENEHVGMSL